MGQAKAKGSFEQRKAAAVEAEKINPKPKRLSSSQQRALVREIASEAVGKILRGPGI